MNPTLRTQKQTGSCRIPPRDYVAPEKREMLSAEEKALYFDPQTQALTGEGLAFLRISDEHGFHKSNTDRDLYSRLTIQVYEEAGRDFQIMGRMLGVNPYQARKKFEYSARKLGFFKGHIWEKSVEYIAEQRLERKRKAERMAGASDLALETERQGRELASSMSVQYVPIGELQSLADSLTDTVRMAHNQLRMQIAHSDSVKDLVAIIDRLLSKIILIKGLAVASSGSRGEEGATALEEQMRKRIGELRGRLDQESRKILPDIPTPAQAVDREAS